MKLSIKALKSHLFIALFLCAATTLAAQPTLEHAYPFETCKQYTSHQRCSRAYVFLVKRLSASGGMTTSGIHPIYINPRLQSWEQAYHDLVCQTVLTVFKCDVVLKTDKSVWPNKMAPLWPTTKVAG